MSIDRELDIKDMVHIYNGILLLFTPSVVPNSFANSWTTSHQVPLSRGFPRQEYWSGFHLLLQRIFLTQGPNPRLLRLLHCQAVLYH